MRVHIVDLRHGSSEASLSTVDFSEGVLRARLKASYRLIGRWGTWGAWARQDGKEVYLIDVGPWDREGLIDGDSEHFH